MLNSLENNIFPLCFYLLQPLCGSSKTVQFAVPGSFLRYLNELGFGFASILSADYSVYYHCQGKLPPTFFP